MDNKLKIHVGRSSQCDFTVPEQHGAVSGHHATIYETDSPDVFMFEDHSTNGSYVNGKHLHNESCTVNVSDHITLGKTYILPLADIAARYFTARRTTTKKMRQPEPVKEEPIIPTPPVSSDDVTRPVAETEKMPSVITVEKIVEKEVEKVVEKIPAWMWVLYVASVIIALFVGDMLNLLN